jgi:hypothetical protein
MKRSNLIITLIVLFIGSTIGGLFDFTPTETAVASETQIVPRFIDVPRQNDVKIDVNVTAENINDGKPVIKYVTVTVEKPTYVVDTRFGNKLLNRFAKLEEAPKNSILQLANIGEDKTNPVLE